MLMARFLQNPGRIIYSDSLKESNNNGKNSYLQIVFEHGGILPIDDNPKVNETLKRSSFNGIQFAVWLGNQDFICL